MESSWDMRWCLTKSLYARIICLVVFTTINNWLTSLVKELSTKGGVHQVVLKAHQLGDDRREVTLLGLGLGVRVELVEHMVHCCLMTSQRVLVSFQARLHRSLLVVRVVVRVRCRLPLARRHGDLKSHVGAE